MPSLSCILSRSFVTAASFLSVFADRSFIALLISSFKFLYSCSMSSILPCVSHATVVLVYLLKNGSLKPDDFLGDGVGLMLLVGEGARDVRGGVCGMSLGI